MVNAIFNLDNTIKIAERRLCGLKPGRRPRSDAGISRLAETVESFLRRSYSTHEKPSVNDVYKKLRAFCEKKDLPTPSRMTVYRFEEHLTPPEYRIEELPPAVRASLYNLDVAGAVPGAQLCFYCFNYGSTETISFASGLPWVCLERASMMSGHRAGAKWLLEAVLKTRGII